MSQDFRKAGAGETACAPRKWKEQETRLYQARQAELQARIREATSET